MTVSRFFWILIRLVLIPFLAYWAIKLHFYNDKNQRFGDLMGSDGLFTASFIGSTLCLVGFVICIVTFMAHNSEKSIAIVLSPQYLYKNFWSDVSRAFDSDNNAHY